MCLPVPEGWFALEKSEAPMKCPAGQQVSPKKDGCKTCISGYYNPEEGSKCKRCPDFTFPNSERTKCVPYDRITTKYGNMFALYMLRPEQFCRKKENIHYCNQDKNAIGPINQNKFINTNQDVLFFFTNSSPLLTDSIEFHKQKSTSETNQNHSYIYLIFELKHAQVSQI